MPGDLTAKLSISSRAFLSQLCGTACKVHGDASNALLRVLILGVNGDCDVVRIAPRPDAAFDTGMLPIRADEFFGAENCAQVADAVRRAVASGGARLRFVVEPAAGLAINVDALFLPPAVPDGYDAVCDVALVAAGDDAADTIARHFRFLERAADDARDALIVADASGTIMHVSAGATALFGYEAAEIIGQGMDVLMPEPFRSRHSQYVASYRETGRGKILGIGPRELPARHRDNSTIPIELSVSEAEWNGQRMFIGLCRDISARMDRERELQGTQKTLRHNLEKLGAANLELERREAEAAALAERLKAARDEARAANRAKSDFLATMSHEIRTPLNGIIGMAQILATTPLDPDQRENLSVIIESSDTLLGLLNELLDLSKIESGRMLLEPRATELSKFLAPVVEHWRQRAVAKKLRFDIRLGDDLPASAVFDPIRLRQVIDNLLSNAVKFTDSGAIALDVCLDGGVPGDHGLRFEVRDTGVGIKPEHQATIFDSFMQADSSITRRFGGTGLGLAISKRLVELMNGTIVVESTLGEGTQFRVTLPCQCEEVACSVQAGALAPAASAATPARADQSGSAGLNVLIAEDNRVNQKVVTTILAALGHRAIIAGNGREAIRLLETGERFDLVLMDLHMPEMDGLAATRAIRARADSAAAIPIIGLTASAMGRDREECLAAGMTDFVTKPIKIDALAQALSEVAPQAIAPASDGDSITPTSAPPPMSQFQP